MLTTEQIRTLNDARTILGKADAPHTWEGGRASATYDRAEKEIFQALNVTRAYLEQEIPDSLMHNREEDVIRSLGRADSVEIVGDEDGFELHISTDQGAFVVNVHDVSRELLAQVTDEIGAYWKEGRRAAREHQHDLDRADAYDLRNPKHPEYHSVHADLYDSRVGEVITEPRDSGKPSGVGIWPKPRARRAESITQAEVDVHHWLGRLAMCLAVASHEMPDHMKRHVRKTLDEFLLSGASSETLARFVRDEVKR